jgi:hypothetical protein
MALAGACIVMTGLAMLAFIISQLHKIVGVLERKPPPPKDSTPQNAMAETSSAEKENDVLADLAVTAKIYKPLTAGLGDTFVLTKLYHILEQENLPHPHLTIRALRDAGYLAPAGEGAFAWKNV